jgi:hypothetical protein
MDLLMRSILYHIYGFRRFKVINKHSIQVRRKVLLSFNKTGFEWIVTLVSVTTNILI